MNILRRIARGGPEGPFASRVTGYTETSGVPAVLECVILAE